MSASEHPEPETDAPAARVGETLQNKWHLDRLLGVGGMASVYAATHRNGKRAAVKVLHPELAFHADVRERFLREGYLANKVDQRGVDLTNESRSAAKLSAISFIAGGTALAGGVVLVLTAPSDGPRKAVGLRATASPDGLTVQAGGAW